MIEIDVDEEGMRQIVADLSATEAQAKKALNSTLVKMAAWLRSKSTKGLSTATDVPQKVIRRRLRSYRLSVKPDSSSITIWYGLDPIELIWLNAKQNKTGVAAMGNRRVKSAFIAPDKNGRKHVFKRVGKSRLPIERQIADVHDRASIYIEDNLLGTAEFDARFLKTFEHELQWRMRAP